MNKIPILDESCEQNEYLLIFSNDNGKIENVSEMAMDEDNEEIQSNTDRVDATIDSNCELINNDDEQDIEKFNNKINHHLLSDLLAIMDSKDFANKINSYFLLNISKSDLNDACFYTSHICYFVLIKSSLKMHQST